MFKVCFVLQTFCILISTWFNGLMFLKWYLINHNKLLNPTSSFLEEFPHNYFLLFITVFWKLCCKMEWWNCSSVFMQFLSSLILLPSLLPDVHASIKQSADIGKCHWFYSWENLQTFVDSWDKGGSRYFLGTLR